MTPGSFWIIAAGLALGVIAWLAYEAWRAPTLTDHDPSGYSDGDLARIINFPARLHVVKDALDLTGEEAARVWPNSLAGRRAHDRLLEAEFSPFDRGDAA